MYRVALLSESRFYHLARKYHRKGPAALCGRDDHFIIARYVVNICSLDELENVASWKNMCMDCVRVALEELQRPVESVEIDYPMFGFKSIRWESWKEAFVSPLHSQFRWPREGYVEAQCNVGDQKLNELGFTKHVPGTEGCGCGIYAVTAIKDADKPPYCYGDSLIILIAGLGEMEVWSNGFRAEAARVEAVVKHPDLPDSGIDRNSVMWPVYKAVEYFNVDLITIGQAYGRIHESWRKNGFQYMLSVSQWRVAC